MKKRAFTLSEVMITLLLIGVIASLTITNVSTSIQKRMRLAQFKSAYSMLQTALENVNSEAGHIYACYLQIAPGTDDREDYGIDSDVSGASAKQCSEFKEKFLNNLGVSHSCESDSVEEGCITNKYTFPNSNCLGFKSDFNKNKAYVLDNGMILIEASSHGIREFAIDVNGRKGPNRWGVDLFTFQIMSTGVKTIGNTKFVTDVAIMPPSTGNCLPGASADGSTKSSAQMWKEMVGVKD